jgi:hypothetical protein
MVFQGLSMDDAWKSEALLKDEVLIQRPGMP